MRGLQAYSEVKKIALAGAMSHCSAERLQTILRGGEHKAVDLDWLAESNVDQQLHKSE